MVVDAHAALGGAPQRDSSHQQTTDFDKEAITAQSVCPANYFHNKPGDRK